MVCFATSCSGNFWWKILHKSVSWTTLTCIISIRINFERFLIYWVYSILYAVCFMIDRLYLNICFRGFNLSHLENPKNKVNLLTRKQFSGSGEFIKNSGAVRHLVFITMWLVIYNIIYWTSMESNLSMGTKEKSRSC